MPGKGSGENRLLCNAMDPAAVEEFRKLEQEKNRLEGEIKTLYEYLTEDGCLAEFREASQPTNLWVSAAGREYNIYNKI